MSVYTVSAVVSHPASQVTSGEFSGSYSFNDSVGIGTTSPGANLEIKADNTNGMLSAGLGTKSLTGDNSFAIAPSGTINITGNEAGFIGSATSATVSGHRTLVFGLDNGLAIGDVSTSGIMSIMGGNVGIGTTSPDTKLEVQCTDSSYCMGLLNTAGTPVANLWTDGVVMQVQLMVFLI